MSMLCPQCRRSFEQRLDCPDCGVRLLFDAGLESGANRSRQRSQDGWQQTPWGRLAVGLLLAQGLGYGLQQLLTAGLMVSGEATSVWATLWGILCLQALQGLSVLIGGALCGAGRERGALFGCVIGLVNGLISCFMQRQSGEATTEIALYGQPIIHLVFGAVGGWLGSWIWRPVPTISLDGPSPDRDYQSPGISLRFLDGPLSLGRVFAGVFLVVVGVVWSNAILEWVLTTSQGTLAIRTHLHAQLVGWEICALATLVGAGVAGASTINGLKQGLFVGLGASVVLAGIQFSNPNASFQGTVLLLSGIFVLTAVGGWFGGQLFPPVLNAKRRSRLLTQ